VLYLVNSFSLNMLATLDVNLTVREVSIEAARNLAEGAVSAVGHADTARVFAALLGREVEHARATLRLSPGDRLLVGQYSGPRLPEGATSLPEGATIAWLTVDLGGAS
jgi:protein involved in polysaccharide export with SLBB domain